MDNNFIVRVHRGTMFLPDDAVGWYQIFDVKQDKPVAIFYFNPLSQPEAYFKASELVTNSTKNLEKNEKELSHHRPAGLPHEENRRWEI